MLKLVVLSCYLACGMWFHHSWLYDHPVCWVSQGCKTSVVCARVCPKLGFQTLDTSYPFPVLCERWYSSVAVEETYLTEDRHCIC